MVTVIRFPSFFLKFTRYAVCLTLFAVCSLTGTALAGDLAEDHKQAGVRKLAPKPTKIEPNRFGAKDKFQPFLVTKGPKQAAINSPLTKVAGDQARGDALVANKTKGDCLSCHYVTSFEPRVKKQPKIYGNMGLVGPDLGDAVQSLSLPEMRAVVVDPMLVDKGRDMPGYFNTRSLKRVAPAYKGKTILTAQEVEDVLAFLVSLKTNKTRKGQRKDQ